MPFTLCSRVNTGVINHLARRTTAPPVDSPDRDGTIAPMAKVAHRFVTEEQFLALPESADKIELIDGASSFPRTESPSACFTPPRG